MTNFFGEKSRASPSPPTQYFVNGGSWRPALSHSRSTAISMPSIRHHRISMQTPDSLARMAAMSFLAMIAYFRPGPATSDIILQMASCASVTVPYAWPWLLPGEPSQSLRTLRRMPPGPRPYGLVAFPGGGIGSGTVCQARSRL